MQTNPAVEQNKNPWDQSDKMQVVIVKMVKKMMIHLRNSTSSNASVTLYSNETHHVKQDGRPLETV